MQHSFSYQQLQEKQTSAQCRGISKRTNAAGIADWTQLSSLSRSCMRQGPRGHCITSVSWPWPTARLLNQL